MANSEMLTDFVDDKAKRDIEELTKDVDALVQSVIQLTREAKAFGDLLRQDSSFGNFIANLAKLAGMNRLFCDTVASTRSELDKLAAAQKAYDQQVSKSINSSKAQNQSAGKVMQQHQRSNKISGKSEHEGRSGARADIGREYQAEKHLAEAKKLLLGEELQNNIEHEKAMMDNTSASIENRMEAYERYYAFLEEKARLDKHTALVIEEAKIKALKEKLELDGKMYGTKLSTSEKRSIQSEIAASQLAMQGIARKFETDRARNAGLASEQLVKIQKDEAQKRIDAIANLTSNVKQQEQEALQVLVDRLAAGTLTHKQYVKQKELLEDEYARKRTNSVVEYLEDEVTALEAQGVDVRALVDKLNEYRVRSAATANKLMEDRHKKQGNPLLNALGLDDEQWRYVQQIGPEAVNLVEEITKAVDARYEREIELIDKRKAAREESANDEIAVINKGFLAQKQKDEKIGEIQSKLAYDKKVLDREERDLKRKMAVADRGASIAKIIEGTAVAVIDAMAIPPPFGQILAGIVGAVGAVQLANVMATPLPAYKEGIGIAGKGGHPGGLALVGEGSPRNHPALRAPLFGKEGSSSGFAPEVVIDRGVARIVDRPTIMDLSRDARVIPEHKLLDNLHLLVGIRAGVHSAGGRFSAPASGDQVQDIACLQLIADRMEQAVARIPGVRYSQNVLGVWGKTVDIAGNRTVLANRLAGIK